ncbi:MAG: sigma-70 family RNA polymerase sigma factor [Actinomycetes bacterium]
MRANEQCVPAGLEPQRSRETFQALAGSQLPRLLGLARRLTRDDVEDLVQEALLRAYRSYRTLQADEAGGRWLQTILVNAYRDRLRKRARSVDELAVPDLENFSLFRTIAEEDPFPYSDTLHMDFLGAFGREDVLEVLLRLPEIYRTPLVLCHMEGFATKEIAELCDAPLGTVLSRLHRGRKAFERELWIYARETGLLEESP